MRGASDPFVYGREILIMGGRLWLIYVTMVISYYGREIMAYLCDYGYILLWAGDYGLSM